MKDYYDILGVDKSASADEIKRAYRKLAHQHHPDKDGGNEDKFKEINEAYQILSNPEKRTQYDQFGTTGDQGGFNWGGQAGGEGQSWDFSGGSGFGFGGGLGDIFENIFGSAMSHVQTEIDITLSQAVLGAKIELQTSSKDRITLNIPSGTPDGTTFRFRGKGNSYSRGRGDLMITVRVSIPRRLNREQKELFEKLRDLGV